MPAMTGLEIVGKVFDIALPEVIKAVLHRRLEYAREILQDELRRGAIGPASLDQDEAAAMVFEYIDAAKQGAARRNLRLLAQVMAGQLASPTIYASEFLKWSRILADLSREEIILIATLHRAFQHPTARSSMGGLQEAVKKELISDRAIFDSIDEFEATAHALSRTGLVIVKSTFGGDIIVTTPRVTRLLAVARIEDVLREPD